MTKRILALTICAIMIICSMGLPVFAEETSTLTNAYTSAYGYWGDCQGSADTSFVLKLYHDDTYMGSTSLNNIGGIIDGDVNVTWNMKLDAASNTDEYWTMEWAVAPTLDMQPNKVEHWVDGEKAAECAIEPNAPDSIHPILAAVSDDDGKILSYVNTKEVTLAQAIANGGNITLFKDITLSEGLTVPEGVTVNLDLNGNSIIGGTNAIINYGSLTINDRVGMGKVYTTNVEAQGRPAVRNYGSIIINGGWFGDSNNDMNDRNAINRGNAVSNSGTAVINDGYFTNVSNQYIDVNAYAYAINTWQGATTTINNATVYGDINGLIYSAGTTVVNDGSYTLGRPNEENNLWYLAYGNVEIKGGTWTRAFAVPSWNTENPTMYGDVAVSGGTFNVEIPSTYLADGYVTVKNEDGTYSAKTSVAEINGVKYASLQSAFDLAKETNAEKVALIRDIELDETVTVGEGYDIVLDLNGHTITNVATSTIAIDGGTLTVKDSGENGAIVAANTTGGNDDKAAVLFKANDGKFVLESGTLNSTKYGVRSKNVENTKIVINGGTINADKDGTEDIGYGVYASSGSVTMNGGTINSGCWGIAAYGEFTMNGGKITAKIGYTSNGSHDNTGAVINDGIIDTTKYVGIYWPSAGSLTINGGSIIGPNAVYVKSGSVAITDGTFVANGEKADYEFTASGFVETGDALAIENVGGDTGYEAVKSVSVTGGTFTSANASAVASYAATEKNSEATQITGFISGGTFSSNISAYLAEGTELIRTGAGTYEAVASDSEDGKLTANTISVVYKDITGDAEGKKVYQIIAKANGEDQINEFASAQLSFENTSKLLNGKDMPYVIEAADNMTLSTKQGEPDYYGFAMAGLNADGDEYYEVTSNEVILGTVTFEGYGEVSFKTADGMVNATTVSDNLVDTYSLNGAEDDATTGALVINTDIDETYIGKIDGETIEVPVRDLAINIDFPNAVANQKKAYQDMKVVISGGDLTENIEIELGSDAEEALDLDGKTKEKITVEYNNNEYAIAVTDALTLNRAYTVTVSGAGYRTARYTVTMTKDKELNFWNNVMDEETAVEEGELSEKKNFLAGDIVKDNNINIYDLSAVVSYFGTEAVVAEESEYAKYDLNRDGVIDSRDVAYVLVSWGE